MLNTTITIDKDGKATLGDKMVKILQHNLMMMTIILLL